jgi:hypothetical protein
VDWFTKGCGCESGCNTRRCICKRYKDPHTGVEVGRLCGPGCTCHDCTNMHNNTDNHTLQEEQDVLEQSQVTDALLVECEETEEIDLMDLLADIHLHNGASVDDGDDEVYSLW